MNMPISPRRHALLAVLLALLLVSSPSCDDARRHQASEELASVEVKAPLPDDAAPAEVAKELLRTFRSLQHVRRSGLGTADGKAAYDRSMATIASLTARDMVLARLRKTPSTMIPKDITSARAVQIVSESWTSMLAHYVDGLLIEETLATRLLPDGRVAVTLEAENPEERRKLDELRASGDAKDDEHLRSAALAEGFNVPIRVRIVMRLTKIDNAWRLSDVAIGAPSAASRSLTVPQVLVPPTGVGTPSAN